VSLIADGIPDASYLGAEGTRRARDHRAAAIAELPLNALRLSRGDAAIPTIYS
jgi:nicotinate phosphoribosyltransferase